MKIKILAVGKSKQDFIEAGIQEYLKRLSAYAKIQMEILPDVKLSGSNTTEQVKEKEAEIIWKKLSEDDFVIALDEHGTEMTSCQFASFWDSRLNLPADVIIIIGGVYGLANRILKRADFQLSFSQFTFTHQMIRFILLEQLYRAFTIIKGKKYHY